jgi:phosphoadenosine phosphosulfate reductase
MTTDSALLDELTSADARLERATPEEVIDWVVSRFPGVAMACSFEDVALLHMVAQRAPSTPILFLDTGGHFPETLEFAERVSLDWGLDLVRVAPGPEADAWPCGTERCCELRKVAPLQRALAGRAAWITSVKRVDAPTRAHTPVVGWDEKFSLVKANPLATWSDDDVAYYLSSRRLPEHPLWAKGYASIGCAAVTVPPTDPDDRRSGRWAGADKGECGLHET